MLVIPHDAAVSPGKAVDQNCSFLKVQQQAGAVRGIAHRHLRKMEERYIPAGSPLDFYRFISLCEENLPCFLDASSVGNKTRCSCFYLFFFFYTSPRLD